MDIAVFKNTDGTALQLTNHNSIGINTTVPSHSTYNVDVSGSVLFRHDIDMSGNLDVSGNFNVLGDVSMNQNVDICGNLNIGRIAMFSSDVTVDGTLKVSDLSFNNTTNVIFGGDVDILSLIHI